MTAPSDTCRQARRPLDIAPARSALARRPLDVAPARLARPAALALLLALAPTSVLAQSELWSTPMTGSRAYTASQSVAYTTPPPLDQEVADDFQVTGSVERLVIDGRTCGACGVPILEGVRVRFYEWTAGGPGALQDDQSLTVGDPGLIAGSRPERLDITLPRPFAASGWHFVSVQVVFGDGGGVWNPVQGNYYVPVNQRLHRRDSTPGTGSGIWAPDTDEWDDPIIADFVMSLWGIPGSGLPVIDSIQDATRERSGRLVVHGGLWGAEQGAGRLLVDGLDAIVTQWGSNRIVGYVPEVATLGEVDVLVETDSGLSNAATLTVIPRLPDGRVQWRFEVDADQTWHAPGVAPDGSVHFSDYNHGRLYKLAPDGALLWIRDALRGQSGLGCAGPVAVMDDGTAIVAVNPVGPPVDIVAYGPDGTHRWTFTNPNAVGVLSGPALGPDGNVYCTFSITGDGQMGAVSLSPEGALRWWSSGEPFLNHDGLVGAELAFSSSLLGGPVDQLVVATSSDLQSVVYGLDLADGGTNWSRIFGFGASYLMQLQVEAATGPSGMAYLTETGVGSGAWALRARHPSDGMPAWHFDPGIRGEVSAPVVGSDGVIYFSWDLARVTALSPSGAEIWTHEEPDNIRTLPAISPDDRRVLVAGGPFGESGFFRALDASSGGPLFRVNLPVEDGHLVPQARPSFSHDSRVAFWPVIIPDNPVGDERSYVYALALDTAPAIPGPIGGLRLERLGDRIRLAWSSEAASLGGYRTYRATDREMIPEITAEGVRVAATEAGIENTESIVSGEIGPGTGTVHYYRVVGVAEDGLTEGP